jgi:hypothetical protein
MNRLMRSVKETAQQFVNAADAVTPLVWTLEKNAEQTYLTMFAAAQERVRQLEAKMHGVPAPPADDRDAKFTSVHASVAGWEDPIWQGFEPLPKDSVAIPRMTSVGVFARAVSLAPKGIERTITVPAMIPILGRGGLVVLAEGKDLDAGRDMLQSILVRLIAALPPGFLKLTLVDQLGVGNNLAPLTEFAEAIRGDMVWHDAKQIGLQLETLIQHMAMVTQKYLKTQFENIEAFNAHEGTIAEAYRMLAIANFPSGFDQASAEQVVSIAQNGPRSGVYVVMSVDRKQPMPHGFRLEDISRFCTVLEGTMTAGFLWRPNNQGVPDAAANWSTEVLSRGRVSLDGAPHRSLVQKIASATEKRAIDAQVVKVSYATLAPREYWTETTAEGLSAPIGRSGNKNQMFQLSVGPEPVHHALVGGRTGSGKSVLVKGLITSLCQQYSPEELELYLVDFKGGVEFLVFAELPHARVVALESEREFGVSVLEGLLAEMSRRETIFKEKNVRELNAYRALGEKMSRILLVVDEFQVFFSSGDRLATRARQALDDLARRGRSFGLHVMLASQSVSTSGGMGLEASTLHQFGLRIALALSASESALILSKDNDAAKDLTRPGAAIFNGGGGRVGGNILFQVAYVTDEEIRERVQELNEKARVLGFDRRPLLFEGRRPASIADNRNIVEQLAKPPETSPRSIPVFVGEPAAIQDSHVFYRMRRQAAENLLLVGQHDPTMFSIFASAVTSWAIHQVPDSASIVLFNLTPDDDDDAVRRVFDVLGELPQNVKIGANRNVSAWIDDLVADLEKRRADADAGTGVRHKRTLVGFYGIQRARDLLREGHSAGAVTKKLVKLIHDGPELGIAFIVAADMYANLLRVLEAKDLTDFGGRIAGIGGDSGKVLGEHAMGFSVRENYGVLYEPEKPDVLQKFRTYGLEQLDWLKKHLA